MKTFLFIIAFTIIVASCKTSEANYRQAYEKTIAARDSADNDESIYGGVQRRFAQTVVISEGDTIPVRVKHVSVLDGSAPHQVKMQPYNVVVGQFKQKFNAMSLCTRWRENGYPEAFVVQTAEPYYYIIAASYATAAEAKAAIETVSLNPPVAMREPMPFILNNPHAGR